MATVSEKPQPLPSSIAAFRDVFQKRREPLPDFEATCEAVYAAIDAHWRSQAEKTLEALTLARKG